MLKIDRFKGCLIGLAIGDALGAAVQAKSPGKFDKVTDIIGGGIYNIEPGKWTDATSMALCLADSLVIRNYYREDDLENYLAWFENGINSSKEIVANSIYGGQYSTPYCFAIDNATRKSLESYDEYNPTNVSDTKESGSIKRLAPVPLFFSDNPSDSILYSGNSSKTTHNSKVCIDACRYLGALIYGAVNELSKNTILSELYTPVAGCWDENPLCNEILEIAYGSFKSKEPPEIRGDFNVMNCLEAALWAFYKSNNFRDGCLLAVNLGEDAISVGAVYGQIAGAYYGYKNIPDNWLKKLYWHDHIVEIAVKIYKC
jgi:ADP-ribosyl-[dinitrogen reductase] hydrolase